MAGIMLIITSLKDTDFFIHPSKSCRNCTCCYVSSSRTTTVTNHIYSAARKPLYNQAIKRYQSHAQTTLTYCLICCYQLVKLYMVELRKIGHHNTNTDATLLLKTIIK